VCVCARVRVRAYVCACQGANFVCQWVLSLLGARERLCICLSAGIQETYTRVCTISMHHKSKHHKSMRLCPGGRQSWDATYAQGRLHMTWDARPDLHTPIWNSTAACRLGAAVHAFKEQCMLSAL